MNNNNEYKKWGMIVGLFIIIVWSLGVFFLDSKILGWESTISASGIFTAIGTLFTGLSFTAFIITLIMQRAELKAQMDMLELQGKELKDNTNALNLQKDVLLQQKEEMETTNAHYRESAYRDIVNSAITKLHENLNNLTLRIGGSAESFNNLKIGRYALELKKSTIYSESSINNLNFYGVNSLKSSAYYALRLINGMSTRDTSPWITRDEHAETLINSITYLEWLFILRYGNNKNTEFHKKLQKSFYDFTNGRIEQATPDETAVGEINNILFNYAKEKFNSFLADEAEGRINISERLMLYSDNKYTSISDMLEDINNGSSEIRTFIKNYGYNFISEIENQLKVNSEEPQNQYMGYQS